MFLQGAQATAMGKILAGCRFQTYYPITPATDESEYLESHPDGKVVVVQCEDEIAALTMAIGSALTGARASTSTSGPGFNLMVESFGWAGINEVPVVLVNYQRGGPSTGLPTRHEQGDLKFALNAGHGDFPRIVLAPGDLEEAFWGIIDCFNWAERYQMPAVFLHDKNLANNSMLVDAYDFKAARIDRGDLLADDEVAGHAHTNGAEYFERFKFDEKGWSARTVLGQKHGIHWLTGDEHDERGHISEDPTNRMEQMVKRMNKLETALKEIPKEKKIGFYGPADADLTVVSWGSNKGAILDAMEELKEEGLSVNFLHVMLMSPFPAAEVEGVLKKAKTTVLVEMNFSGQLGGWIRQNTGIDMDHKVLKFTGRPMTQDEVSDALRKIAKEGSKGPVREVLTHGV
jgi:2-oxoglutarate ferredoxin oxidoreductase subunit alpha